MGVGIGLTLPAQQLLELHFKNIEMTSVKDVKPRIPKFLHSQTEDKHAEHFSGAWPDFLPVGQTVPIYESQRFRIWRRSRHGCKTLSPIRQHCQI